MTDRHIPIPGVGFVNISRDEDGLLVVVKADGVEVQLGRDGVDQHPVMNITTAKPRDERGMRIYLNSTTIYANDAYHKEQEVFGEITRGLFSHPE